MEDFDFTTPINVTVIFDDSDDEKPPCNEEVKAKKKTANDINSNISTNSLTDKEKAVHDNAPTTELRSITGEEEIKNNSSETETLKSIEIRQNDTGSSTSSQINNVQLRTNKHVVNKIESQILHQNKNKRKILDSEQQILNKRLNMESPEQVLNSKSYITEPNKPSKTYEDEALAHKKNISNAESLIQFCNQSQNIIKEETLPQALTNLPPFNDHHTKDTKVYQNIKTSTLTSQTNSIIPHQNPSNCANEMLSQSDNSTKETTKLRDLLKTVSEYMIYIMNSYQAFIKIQKSSAEPSLIQHAKDNFHRTKNHFFEMSYITVLNTIIPRENDVAFVKNFLNYTIKLAQIKSYPFTYAHMEPLYLEIITWVKKKRDEKNRISTFNLLSTEIENNIMNIKNTSNITPIPTIEHNEHLISYPTYLDHNQKLFSAQQMQSTNLGIDRVSTDTTRIPSRPYINPHLQQTPNSTMQKNNIVTGTKENTMTFNRSRIPPPPYPTHKSQIQNYTAQQQVHASSPELNRVLGNKHGIPSHPYDNYNLEQIQKLQQKIFITSTETKCLNASEYPNPNLKNTCQVQKMSTNRNTKDTSPGVFQDSPYINYSSGRCIAKSTPEPKNQKTSTEINTHYVMQSRAQERNINMDPIIFPKKPLTVVGQRCFPIVSPPQNAQHYRHNQICNTQNRQNTLYGFNNTIPPWQFKEKNLHPTPTYNDMSNVQWQKHMTQSCQKQSPWLVNPTLATAAHSSCPQNDECDPSQKNQPLRVDISAPTESIRSSISRDSGFISPLNFNSSNEQLGTVQEVSKTKPKQNVSLPNLESKEGFCALCGKTTNKQCLGCFKCFYCSFDCQLLNWKKHESVCK